MALVVIIHSMLDLKNKRVLLPHIIEHQQSLNEQLGTIQNDFNEFRQHIIDLKKSLQQHSLIKLIDQWENDSIRKIKQKAEACRQRLINHTSESVGQIEIKLNETNQQFSSTGKQRKNLSEIHSEKLKEKPEELNEELNQPENLPIEQISNSFVLEISVRWISKSKLHLFLTSFQILSRKILVMRKNFWNWIEIFFSWSFPISHRWNWKKPFFTNWFSWNVWHFSSSISTGSLIEKFLFFLFDRNRIWSRKIFQFLWEIPFHEQVDSIEFSFFSHQIFNENPIFVLFEQF